MSGGCLYEAWCRWEEWIPHRERTPCDSNSCAIDREMERERERGRERETETDRDRDRDRQRERERHRETQRKKERKKERKTERNKEIRNAASFGHKMDSFEFIHIKEADNIHRDKMLL